MFAKVTGHHLAEYPQPAPGANASCAVVGCAGNSVSCRNGAGLEAMRTTASAPVPVIAVVTASRLRQEASHPYHNRRGKFSWARVLRR